MDPMGLQLYKLAQVFRKVPYSSPQTRCRGRKVPDAAGDTPIALAMRKKNRCPIGQQRFWGKEPWVFWWVFWFLVKTSS